MPNTKFFLYAVSILALLSLCVAEDSNKTASAMSAANAGASAPIFQRAETSQAVAVTATDENRTQVSEANIRAASPAELDGMELTLQHYKSAFENLSLAQMRQVWPGLDRHRASALKDVFAYLRTSKSAPQLGLECAPPTVIGDSAKVQCRETLAYSDEKGKTRQAKPAMVSIQLKKQSDSWVVETMKGLGN